MLSNKFSKGNHVSKYRVKNPEEIFGSFFVRKSCLTATKKQKRQGWQKGEESIKAKLLVQQKVILSLKQTLNTKKKGERVNGIYSQRKK